MRLICGVAQGRPPASNVKPAACGWPPRRAYRLFRSCGRVAEGGGLLNRYRVVKPYRGFESLRLRQNTNLRYRAIFCDRAADCDRQVSVINIVRLGVAATRFNSSNPSRSQNGSLANWRD